MASEEDGQAQASQASQGDAVEAPNGQVTSLVILSPFRAGSLRGSLRQCGCHLLQRLVDINNLSERPRRVTCERLRTVVVFEAELWT
jgi:hypothetical protein